MQNHHPFNAVPPQRNEFKIYYGTASTNNIFPLGTYSPDSVNVHIQSDIQKLQESYNRGLPLCLRYGRGKGYSVALQGSSGSFRGGMHRCNYENRGWADQVQAKAYLAKSFKMAEDLYLAISPAGSISSGVGAPAQSYRIKFFHKGFEIPVTLSYLWENPLKIKDGYLDLIFSGTVRGARDCFKGDMNRCGPEAFTTIWYDDQPINKVQRYAAMAHLELELSQAFKLTAQYGREYGKTKHYKDAYPVFYVGFESCLNPKNR